MPNLERARKRLTDLVDGLREVDVVYKKSGKTENMTPIQRKVFNAYARQIERVVEDDLQDE